MPGLRISLLLFSALFGCAAQPVQVPAVEAPAPSVEEHNPDDVEPWAETPPAAKKPVTLPPLPEGTRVLHVGSSTAGALGPDLKREFEERGIRCVLKFQQSTYIPQWAGPKMGLKGYLHQYDPDLVVVSLGGNEVEIPDPTQRIGAIRRLVKAIGDRPCIWVGTPRWKALRHTGLLEVIKEHAAPCHFIDTDELAPDMQPLKDGIHPTVAERRRWAERIIQWLQVNRDPQGEYPWSFKDVTEMPAEDPSSAERE